MILRVESSEGTKRVDVDPSESVSNFLNKVQSAFGLDSSVKWSLCRTRDNMDPLYQTDARMSMLQFRNGDRLYLTLLSAGSTEDAGMRSYQATASATASGAPAVAAAALSSQATASVKEDEIDCILSKSDGTIERKRDAQLCRHGDQGKCIHCTPIQPFDPGYLAKQEIKHMSFHTFIRKQHSGADKGKFLFLENLSCKVKPGCTEHAPWPNGICTKCQPSAVTLKRQEYRHVDNIMFEDRSIIEDFLGHWRKSGQQRLGILFGKYTEFKDVPLGIKAVVSAIYEPPQENSPNGVSLLEDTNEPRIREMALQLGLRPVGWVFSDLESQDSSAGTVKYFRHMDTYFLSAEECIMAADFQVRHPSPCKYSSSGYFGSKFVTVVVSGGVDNQICMEGYQVTDQCMALVRDDCFVPTVDAPELGYIRESTSEQYIPDVFYKKKDKYNSEVTKIARPLPVEYLLVQTPVAAPVTPDPMFPPQGKNGSAFPIENREALGELQDFPAFCKYMQQNSSDFLAAASNFHVLCFMACSDLLPTGNMLGTLCNAVAQRDAELARQWSMTHEWTMVVQMMESMGGAGDAPMQTGGMDGVDDGSSAATGSSLNQESGTVWQCQHCTFLNPYGSSACEMCSLPRS